MVLLGDFFSLLLHCVTSHHIISYFTVILNPPKGYVCLCTDRHIVVERMRQDSQGSVTISITSTSYHPYNLSKPHPVPSVRNLTASSSDLHSMSIIDGFLSFVASSLLTRVVQSLHKIRVFACPKFSDRVSTGFWINKHRTFFKTIPYFYIYIQHYCLIFILLHPIHYIHLQTPEILHHLTL